jgi:hypothetical protein
MRSSQMWGKQRNGAIPVVLSALILSGCHSRVPTAVPGSTPPSPTAAVFTELKADDKVRVTLQNGNIVSFVLAEVQTEALVAKDGRRFAYADIARLEETRISKSKTVALTGGLIVIGLLIAIGAALSSLAGNI